MGIGTGRSGIGRRTGIGTDVGTGTA